MCVDYLTSILARLAGRQFPPLYRYEGETLRVVAIVPSFQGLLAESFDQIRGSAEANFAILARMLGAISTLGSLTIRSGYLHALDEQLQCIGELVDRNIWPSYDRARLEIRLSEVRHTLETQHAISTGVEKV